MCLVGTATFKVASDPKWEVLRVQGTAATVSVCPVGTAPFRGQANESRGLRQAAE